MSSSKTVVLVTGGNSGIGFDTCAKLATSAGYHVFMASRSLEKGQAALADLKARELPGTVSLVQLDVTDTASISAAADAVAKEAGHLDVLINNAGIGSRTGSLQDQFRETMDTNVTGQALVTDAFVPLLKKSSSPRVIYVSSALGSISFRLNPPNPAFNMEYHHYRVSKAALNMLATCHYMLFKEWGCKVWAFEPGFVLTNLGGGGEKEMEQRKKMGARSSETSAEGMLEIVEGKRDAQAGQFIHRNGENMVGPKYKDGVYPW